MEESKELKSLYSFLQGAIYFTIFLEAFMLFGGAWKLIQTNEKAHLLFVKMHHLPIYSNIFYSKFFTLLLVVIVSIGTKAKKSTELKIWRHILLPLSIGLILFFSSVYLLLVHSKIALILNLTLPQISYILCSIPFLTDL